MSDDKAQLQRVAHSFNKILNQKYPSKSRSSKEIEDASKKLRLLILLDQIPASVVSPPALTFLHAHLCALQDATIRPRLWKILLRINDLSSDTYLQYVARGPCEVSQKIRNDTFRSVHTMPNLQLVLTQGQNSCHRSRVQGASS